MLIKLFLGAGLPREVLSEDHDGALPPPAGAAVCRGPIRGRTRPARYAGFAKADRRGSNHLDMEQGTSTKWIETQAKITELREENDALRIAYPAFLSNVHNFPALTNVGKEMPPRQNYPLRAALSDLASFAVGHTCSCQEAR